MKLPVLPTEQETDDSISLDQPLFVLLSKIYLHGIIALLVLYVLFAAVSSILPYFNFIANPPARVVLAVFSILLLPPLVGIMIRFVIFPMIEKHSTWSRFSNWDERLFSEVVRAKESAQIVLVDWPTDRLRTLGVLTRSFVDESTGEKLAAVYILSTATTRHGYVHVCRFCDVTQTNMTLKQWQLFHVTLGAFGPKCVQTRDTDAEGLTSPAPLK